MKKYLLPLATLFIVFSFPVLVFADDDSVNIRTDTYDTSSTGLVPNCSGPDCNFCHVVELVNNIINWLITILTVVAVIALVVAGIRMVTSGGNSETLQKAKGTFVNIIIGFVLVLAAWLIVDTLLKFVTENGQGLEFYGQIECGQQLEPISNPNSGNTNTGNTNSNSSGAGNPNSGGGGGI